MAKRALNFSKMDLAELVQLRDQIETALNGRIVIERDELQAKIAELEILQRKRSNSDGRAAGTSKAGKGSTKASVRRKAHALKGRKAEPKYRGAKRGNLGRPRLGSDLAHNVGEKGKEARAVPDQEVIRHFDEPKVLTHPCP